MKGNILANLLRLPNDPRHTMIPGSGELRPADRRPKAGAVLVDGHVHFHACFAAKRFLESAASNFAVAAAALGTGNPPGWLMMTEARGEQAFARLRDALDCGGVPGWTARPTREATSIAAVRDGDDALMLVAGRQVTTREGIEILAFNMMAQTLHDAGAIEDTLEAVWEAGSIAVIPWGFGKWWGRRGKLVSNTLTRFRDRPLLLGDNAGRLQCSTDPALFNLARAFGVAILPGSDPLPFASEATKAGKYGFVLHGPIDNARPGAAVVKALSRQGTRVEPFGTRERLVRFARLQIAMQWRLRVAGNAR